MPKKTTDPSVRRSSGNVFKDLQLPGAQEALAKAEIARQIALIMSRSGITQVECAQLLGIDQPKVSALLRGRLSGFSTERLLRFITAMGQDVEIAIRPKPKTHARGQIRVLKKRSTKAT